MVLMSKGFAVLYISLNGDIKMAEKIKRRSFYSLPVDSTIELTNKCFTHTEKSAFSLWDLLETQRSKVDPQKEPEIYKTLSSIADDMFELWRSIKASAKEYDCIEILMFLERGLEDSSCKVKGGY
jgi:hypothetical protein